MEGNLKRALGAKKGMKSVEEVTKGAKKRKRALEGLLLLT
jgi:hypothetical protein